MSRSLTVLLTTIEANPHHAGIEINTKDRTWVVGGPAANIFTTKKGTYSQIGFGDEKLLVLQKPADISRVGDLRGGFDADTTPEGATGTGMADESGTSFTWKADKSIDL